MRKLLVLSILLLSTQVILAQFTRGRIIFSPMFGYQDEMNVLNKNSFDENKTYTTSGSYVPVLNVDYGITDLVSIGIGVAYQEIQVVQEDYRYLDHRTGLEVQEPLAIDFTRIEPGIRAYIHFVDHSHIDVYSGFKIGYAIWSDPEYTSNDEQIFDQSHLRGRELNFQTFLGLRCYFARYFGAHVEAALIAPYQLAVGLNYRIFTKASLKHQPSGQPIKSRDQLWYRLFRRY